MDISASNPGFRRPASPPARRVRRLAGAAVLAAAAMVLVACGGSDSGGGDADASSQGGGSTTAIAAPDETTTVPAERTTVPEPADTGGTPSAWPADLPLPAAVDPTGAVIPDSLVTDDDPPDGDVVLFTFTQGEGTALQSAYTGVGVWAEALDDFPNGTPCVKADASAAALGGGGFTCDGMAPDGRVVQVATSLVDGRLSLDVLIKRP